MKKMLVSLFAATAVLPLIAASVYYASPTGDDSYETNSEETPWTLTNCVKKATSYDEVRLLKGRYLLTTPFAPYAYVTARGWGGTRDEIILDGQGACRCLTTSNNAYKNIHVENITCTNGYAAGSSSTDVGGCVQVLATGFTMTNCVISGGTCNSGSYGYGAGVYNTMTNTDFYNCDFIGNTAKTGAGFYGCGKFTRCNFRNNTTTATGQTGGGAIFTTGSDLVFTDCEFTGNVSAGYGGAYYGINPGYFTNCQFRDNSCATSGGAIYIANNPLTLVDCYFTNCVAESISIAHGGAVQVSNNRLAMTNCTFIGCYGADGGAASVSRAQAGEIYRATVTAVGCTFIGNYMRSAWPSSCLGGAFYLYGVDKGLIDRCEFRGNYSTNSIGVIYHRDNGYGCEEFVIRNCLFDGNKTASALAKNGTQRSGIDTGSTNFFVRSCTFVNNTSSGLYPAMKTYVVAATNRVSNCLFHNNTSDNGSQYNDVAATSAAYRNYYYNCYFSSGLISTNGCIGGGDKSDPKFTDAANGDYTLLKGSPCIDAGTYETWMADAKDLRNLKKPNRIENGIVDIGCYEYLPFVGGTMISFR